LLNFISSDANSSTRLSGFLQFILAQTARAYSPHLQAKPAQ